MNRTISQQNYMFKFLKYLLVGFSALVLLYVAQAGMLNATQGPQPVFADRCDDNGDGTCSYYDDNGNFAGIHIIGGDEKTGQGSKTSQGSTTSQGSPTTPAPACSDNSRSYPQCGGTCNGTSYSGTTKLWVTEKTSSSCTTSWDCSVVQENSTECGYQAPAEPARQPQNNCGSLPKGESTCRDGKIVFCKVDGNGDANITDTGSTCSAPAQPQRASFVNNCQGKANGESTCLDGQIKVCRCFSDGCSLENTGSTCGGQGSPAAPAPQPAPQSQPQPSVSCPSGTTLVNNTCRPNTICQPGTTLVMTSTGPACLPINNPIIGGNSNINNNANSNVNTITVNSQPAQPVVRFATSECPDGFTRRVDGNTITCIAPAPQVVTVAAASATKELPKTGLPALVWAAASFVPLGFRMKRFGRGITPNFADPNFIWEERQFRSGIDKI